MSTAARALLLLVALRFVAHALYVPAYEGPDEPFHLAHGERFVDPAIVASIASHPCSADLQKAIGCAPFGSAPAEWNVLGARASRPLDGWRPASPRERARDARGPAGEDARAPVANYEYHQPPGYYAVLPLLPVADLVTKLLAMRLFSVLLVLLALVALRTVLPDRAFCAALVVLLIPGAAESLARCANDPAVFLWSAIVMWALHRRVATPWLALLAALGPLCKLTAIPIVALIVLWTFFNRPRVHALLVALASLAFLPLQWLRGFAWGGTVELNAARAPFHETFAQSAVGLARSGYTFAKTAFWLGEWSFFRAPIWLLVLVAIFIIAAVVSLQRRKAVEWKPHIGALIVATGATLWWFISHRLFWGDWGGVGGWYAWAWFPWLAVAAHELFTIRRGRALFIAGALLVIVANVAWFVAAHHIYAK